MAQSTDFSLAEALQDYTLQYADEFIGKSFYGFQTAQSATIHDGVKGKLLLTEMILGSLVSRWKKNFSPIANTIQFSPRELDVTAVTLELQIYPQEFEASYLGYKRAASFNNQEVMIQEAWIMMKIAEKRAQEIENAIWRGEAAAVPASSDLLIACIDGFLTIIADDQAAVTPVLTPFATPGGSLTANNVIATIEGTWDLLDASYKDLPTECYVSPDVWAMYQRAYREEYGKYTALDVASGRVQLDFANCTIVRTPGMGTSSRIVITPRENLHIGYDGLVGENFNIEKNHRAIDMIHDFKIGVQIGMLQQGIIAINDLA